MRRVLDFIRECSGATSIEYGVMAALIAVAMMTGADMLGSTTDKKLSAIATAIDSPSGSPPPAAAPPSPAPKGAPPPSSPPPMPMPASAG